jgi:hypothetical protein
MPDFIGQSRVWLGWKSVEKLRKSAKQGFWDRSTADLDSPALRRNGNVAELCALLVARYLRRNGASCGAYTSPHFHPLMSLEQKRTAGSDPAVSS